MRIGKSLGRKGRICVSVNPSVGPAKPARNSYGEGSIALHEYIIVGMVM